MDQFGLNQILFLEFDTQTDLLLIFFKIWSDPMIRSKYSKIGLDQFRSHFWNPISNWTHTNLAYYIWSDDLIQIAKISSDWFGSIEFGDWIHLYNYTTYVYLFFFFFCCSNVCLLYYIALKLTVTRRELL